MPRRLLDTSAPPKKARQADLFDQIGDFMGAVEKWADVRGIEMIIGVDEAGRGPLAGPVVAAAVCLDLERATRAGWLSEIGDSKRLSAARRERLFDFIRLEALACGIAQKEASEIDDGNILKATLDSMAEAVEQVHSRLELSQRLVVVDGNRPIPGLTNQRAIIKGDRRSFNIAAASILAKVYRDRIMERYDCRWPEYEFARHKGYPTRRHRELVLELGYSPIHRRSFTVSEPR